MTQQITLLGIKPKKNKKKPPLKNLYMHIHSSITHNNQKVKTTHISIFWQTGKPNAEDEHKGILLSREKEQSTDACRDMGEPWKPCATWKKPDIKVTCCLIPFIWNAQIKQTHRRSEWNGPCLGLGVVEVVERNGKSRLMGPGFLCWVAKIF